MKRFILLSLLIMCCACSKANKTETTNLPTPLPTGTGTTIKEVQMQVGPNKTQKTLLELHPRKISISELARSFEADCDSNGECARIQFTATFYFETYETRAQFWYFASWTKNKGEARKDHRIKQGEDLHRLFSSNPEKVVLWLGDNEITKVTADTVVVWEK